MHTENKRETQNPAEIILRFCGTPSIIRLNRIPISVLGSEI